MIGTLIVLLLILVYAAGWTHCQLMRTLNERESRRPRRSEGGDPGSDTHSFSGSTLPLIEGSVVRLDQWSRKA